VSALFDNSEANPFNPDPAKLVRWGDQTTDEMMIGYVEFYYADEPKAAGEQAATLEAAGGVN
jgi:hypothetical protein